jgi:hypothetical protein
MPVGRPCFATRAAAVTLLSGNRSVAGLDLDGIPKTTGKGSQGEQAEYPRNDSVVPLRKLRGTVMR